MTRHTLSALLLCGFMAANAALVTPQEALARLNRTSPRKARALGAESELVTLPELYIFSSNRGYVVLPANDDAPSLLGYSDSPLDLTSNPTLQWWLSTYSAQIAAGGHAPMGRSARAAIEPLIATRWDQSAPYNDLCPELNGARCVTGCVATAMAQVLNHHQWPDRGTGSHSYAWQSDTISFNFGATTFDWANMTNTYGAESTAKQNLAVATLMNACGVSVDMNYSPSESGASSTDVPQALVDYFNYDRGVYGAVRDCYGLDEWETLVYDELAAGRPVLYSGTGSAGGHEFVVDGYSDGGYFHINWGWSGTSDGYFLLTALDPPSLGIGGGAGGFNSNQMAIIGVQRPVAGSQPAYVVYGDRAFLPTVAAIAKGQRVEFDYAFYNYGGTALPQYTSFGVEILNNATGESAYSIGFYGSGTLAPQRGYGEIAGIFPTTLADGTYTVSPAYCPAGECDYRLIRTPLSMNGSVRATVSGDSVYFSLDEVIGIQVADLAMATPLYWGENCEFTFTAKNIGDGEYYGSVIPLLVDANNNIIAEGSPIPVDVESGDSAPLTYSGTFTAMAKTTPETGSYRLVLSDLSTGMAVSNFLDVTLKATPAATTIAIESIRLADITDTEASFAVTVSCTEGYFAQTLPLYLFKVATGTMSSLESVRTPMYYVESGHTQTRDLTFDISGLESGQYMVDAYYNNAWMGHECYFKIEKQTAIEAVEAPEGALRTYNLQGMPVSHPGHGLYIRGSRLVRL